MKYILPILFVVMSLCCYGLEVDSTVSVNQARQPHRSTLFSLGVGFGDYYRSHPTYTLPAGFKAGNTTGFQPLNVRLEYGLNLHFALSASMYFNRFEYNYSEVFSGNGWSFTRFQSNSFSLFGGGVGAVWYPALNVRMPNIEPFIQVGLSLNNIRQTAVPQGDSTTSAATHRVSPVLKIGGRYFFSSSRNAGIYLELGYDRQSIVNIGFTAKLSRKKGRHLRL